MRLYPQYLRECFPLAIRGSIHGAWNWGSIVGAAALGGLAQYLGAQLVFADGWQGVVASAIIAAIVVWLLIVVLRLLFVAPYQLWKLRYKPQYKKQLQEFYISVTELLQRNLPKDISDEDFERYVTETKQWVDDTARWIQENMSYPARVRFLDRTEIIGAQYSAQVTERHGKIIANLLRFKRNLETLMQNDDWI
jgi:MFS family permease